MGGDRRHSAAAARSQTAATARAAADSPTALPYPVRAAFAAPPVKPRHKLQPRPGSPEIIEPGRRRRIERGRDPIEGRLDLHGLDQAQARERLAGFLLDAQARGARSVLVITGKGFAGQGVLRRRAPEWLSDPRLAGRRSPAWLPAERRITVARARSTWR